MMIKNLIIGWRNIIKNGVYSIINIVGLSLGMAVVVLILFWVFDELSYNRFHKNLDHIYTVYEHQKYSDGQELYTNCTPFPLSQALVRKFAEVERATTFVSLDKMLVKYEEKEYKEGPVVCADSSFLKIFTYNTLEGDSNALSSPDRIIITDDLAQLFFGNKSAIGKVLTFNNDISLTVGAVISAQKANSTLTFKILAPIDVMKHLGADLAQWGNNWPSTCILLAKGGDPNSLNSKITNFCLENGQQNTTLHLAPYKNERLYSYSGKNNRVQYIYQFFGIALILILIASINFINLSTAKAEQRRPEVGIRKVMGASRMNILRQFLLEKGLMIFFSVIISVMLVSLFLPVFRTISGKQIIIGQLLNGYIILIFTLFVILIPLLSVIYPSMYIASINPVYAIKKSLNDKRGGITLKSLLVVVQFALAIILISGTIIITRQIKYLNNYDLGYNHANLVYLFLNGEAKSKHEAIIQELTGITGVESITRSDKLPFWGGNSSWGHTWEGKDPETRVLICQMHVDKNYFKTLGIKFVEGGDFPDIYDKVVKWDEVLSPQVILNREAIRRMGLTNPVGKEFSPWGVKKGKIIGVVEDFHFESLRTGVEPVMMFPLIRNPDYIIARIGPDNFSKTMDAIKKSWLKVMPQTAIEVGFFDDFLEKLYSSEIRISSLFRYFSFIAIFISCIGLFGLSLFVIERRQKEIGIRKVNGARISEVMLLLNRDFIKWVGFSFVIAAPLAWLALSKWLENFAYKTELSWWIFVLAGLLALVIALLTVSWQSWKAATRNPVEALRYE